MIASQKPHSLSTMSTFSKKSTSIAARLQLLNGAGGMNFDSLSERAEWRLARWLAFFQHDRDSFSRYLEFTFGIDVKSLTAMLQMEEVTEACTLKHSPLDIYTPDTNHDFRFKPEDLLRRQNGMCAIVSMYTICHTVNALYRDLSKDGILSFESPFNDFFSLALLIHYSLISGKYRTELSSSNLQSIARLRPK